MSRGSFANFEIRETTIFKDTQMALGRELSRWAIEFEILWIILVYVALLVKGWDARLTVYLDEGLHAFEFVHCSARSGSNLMVKYLRVLFHGCHSFYKVIEDQWSHASACLQCLHIQDGGPKVCLLTTAK